MKKITALLLFVILIATFVTSCGSDSAEEGKLLAADPKATDADMYRNSNIINPGQGVGDEEGPIGNELRPGHGDEDEEPIGNEPRPGHGDDEDEEPIENEPRPGHGDDDEEPIGNEPRPGHGDEDEEPIGNEPRPGHGDDEDEEPIGNEPRPVYGDDDEEEPIGNEPDPGAGDELPRDIAKKYKIINKEMTWKEAKEYCEKLGGHLVVIGDAKEQKIIEKLLSQSSLSFDGYWLGGYIFRGKWLWLTDEAFSYTNWKPGEPNGDSDGMYLQMYVREEEGLYKWDDTWNSGDKAGGIKVHGAICEFR